MRPRFSLTYDVGRGAPEWPGFTPPSGLKLDRPIHRAELRARFDRIFKRRTGFAVLDRLLDRLHANKPELLRVLDRPEIPLHTNGSENDIRAQVTRRKVSGGTRSDMGRDCRDAFGACQRSCRAGLVMRSPILSVVGTTAHRQPVSLPRCSRRR